MLKLGVNIDHVATLRQARYPEDASGSAEPDPVAAARDCVRVGAHSITAHLREDRRHIQVGDVLSLKNELAVPLNLEMATTEPMIDFALRLKPQEVCLVPENRKEVTTEGGLSVWHHEKKFETCVRRLQKGGIHTSLFLDPEPNQIKAAVQTGARCIELHTGAYANARGGERDEQLAILKAAAKQAHKAGLQVNAGHGINYHNIEGILSLPHLDTLNIGHSIVSRAMTVGMAQAVEEMLELMQKPGVRSRKPE